MPKMIPLEENMTSDLKTAIAAVSGMIASDALAGFDEAEYGCTEEELMAEMTLDADRLLTHGYPEAHAEMKTLITAYGWGEVRKAAEKHVCF